MAQYEMNLRDYQRVLRKRYKTILAATILVAAFSWVVARQETALYQAIATVKIEEVGTVSDLLVQSMVTYSVWDNIATQTMVIESLPVMQLVASRLGRSQGDAEALQQMVAAQQVSSTNVIRIVATSPDPVDAQTIADATAMVYDSYSDSLKKKTIKDTKLFIASQLDSCRRRLEAAEDSLKSFQDHYEIPTMGGEEQLAASRLAESESEIRGVDQEIAQLSSPIPRSAGAGGAQSVRGPTVKGAGESGGVASGVRSAPAAPTGSQGELRSDPSSDLLSQLMTLRLEREGLLNDVTELHPDVKVLDEKIQSIKKEIRSENSERMKILKAQRDNLGAEYEMRKLRFKELPDLQLRYTRLLRDVDVNASLYKSLQEKYYEAMIKEADTADEVKVISYAKRPSQPINRDIGGKVGVGVAIGCILGLVLAFIRESLDTSLGTMEDLEEYLGIPVLAMVPHIDMKEQVAKAVAVDPGLADYPDPERQAQLVTQLDSKSGVAESYRILRTHLQYASVDRDCKVIIVTSARTGEGKTMTSSNLAIVLAQASKRTLLVECDLRRPAVHSAFGVDREPGLIGIVLGEIGWRDCVKGVTDIMMGRLGIEGVTLQSGLDSLHIVTCGGAVPPQPAEMLATERMRRFVEEAGAEYDYVILDVPPVLPVTDATVLSGLADGVLLVYLAGQRRADLKLAKIRLDGMTSRTRSLAAKGELPTQARSRVLGVVLNDVRAETVGYSITPRTYYYYAEEPDDGILWRLVGAARREARSVVTVIRNAIQPK